MREAESGGEELIGWAGGSQVHTRSFGATSYLEISIWRCFLRSVYVLEGLSTLNQNLEYDNGCFIYVANYINIHNIMEVQVPGRCFEAS